MSNESEIRREGLIIKPIPENVGRSNAFLQRCFEVLHDVPYFMYFQGSWMSIETKERLADIVREDYKRRVREESPILRAVRFNRKETEIIGYVIELHARLGDEGKWCYFTRGVTPSVRDRRTWITPRVMYEVREDAGYEVPLNLESRSERLGLRI